jgi:hypothetical protein
MRPKGSLASLQKFVFSVIPMQATSYFSQKLLNVTLASHEYMYQGFPTEILCYFLFPLHMQNKGKRNNFIIIVQINS